jgi:hypothetical protein
VARIRSLSPMVANVRPHRTAVDCEYQKVTDGDAVYLHLSTFGSDERQSEKKVSQTMQFGRETAAQLLAAIRETFPGL